MKNLLKNEIYKIVRLKYLYIIWGVITSLNIISSILAIDNYKRFGITVYIGINSFKDRIVDFNYITMYLIGSVILYIICRDFSTTCIRNIFTRNIDRTKYYFSKLIICFFIGYIMYISSLLVYFLITGFIARFDIDNIFNLKNFFMFLYIQTLIFLGEISILQCIGVIFKKFGVSFCVNLGFTLALSFLPYKLNSNNEFLNYIWRYNDIDKIAKEFANYNNNIKDIIICSLVILIIIILYNFIGIKILRKSNI